MAISQPNFNKFNRGMGISASQLNKIAESTASNSVNVPTDGGINSINSSSGTRFNLSENIARPPIWAQIVSIQRVNSEIGITENSGSGTGTTSACPSYIYSYGWVELIEDFNIDRKGQEFFYVNPIPTTTSSNSNSGTIGAGINDSDIKDQTILKCRDINQLGASVGGMTGTPTSFPALEVNNQVTALGTVVKLYFGQGNYMLFTNTGSTATGGVGIVSNVQCVGNVLRVTYSNGTGV